MILFKGISVINELKTNKNSSKKPTINVAVLFALTKSTDRHIDVIVNKNNTDDANMASMTGKYKGGFQA